MKKSRERKDLQLGIPLGTAANRLRKTIMFSLLVKLDENICHRCGSKIENADDLSLDHKEDWLDSDDPYKVFFDIQNVAFSHLSCNAKAGRKVGGGGRKKGIDSNGKHIPSQYSYVKKGCRCEECVRVYKEKRSSYNRKYHKNSDSKLKQTIQFEQ